jgi:hypothetical protein
MPAREVFTLSIGCGRRPGDDLAAGAIGARVLCYAPGSDEADAVRRAVALLKQGGFDPIDIASYGSLSDRLQRGDVGDDERAVIERAAQHDTAIVSDIAPCFPD